MLDRLWRLIRRCLKLAAALLLLGVAAAGVSWMLGGIVVPPVVVAPFVGDWERISKRLPKERHEVEIAITAGDGEEPIVLSGLHFPSDEGAPLVVHFAGSGVSLRGELSRLHSQRQFADLAHLGFASLAVDYRGVGHSTGEVATDQLGADAVAIWKHALTLVDGDPARIILRGCSMGTIAAAELLATGVQPGGVIAVAPVRAQTVAIRYGLAWLPGPTAWLTRPFLKEFAQADTTVELCRARCPRLVIAHEDDELLGPEEYTALVQGVKAAGGQVHTPGGIPGILVRFGPVVDFMPHHIGLAREAMSIEPAEAEFLLSTYHYQLHADERLAKLLEALSPAAKKGIARDPGALSRLRTICARRRFIIPEYAAALASAFDDDELTENFPRLPWPRTAEHMELQRERWDMPFDDLVATLSLKDPDGDLPFRAMRYARSALGSVHVHGTTVRPRERIVALARFAATYLIEGDETSLGPQPAPPSPWWFQVSDEGNITYTDTHPEREVKDARIWNLDRTVALLRESHQGPESSLSARFERCLLKAAGLLP